MEPTSTPLISDTKAVDLYIGQHALIKHLADGYEYWDKIKFKKLPVDASPQTVWAAVKLARRTTLQEIRLGGNLFKYNVPHDLQRQLHEFDLHLGGHLGSQGQVSDEDRQRYLISSIMEEAIASSQIEGAVTTREVAKEMLRQQRPPRDPSERMVTNNYHTIQHIVERQHEPLTVEGLLQIHRLITEGTLEDPLDAGRLRTRQVNVVDTSRSEVVHVPPAHTELPTLIDAFVAFFNRRDEEPFMHPVVKACVLHFLLGWIHPFADGNGRTGRALFYWFLLSRGYWLTQYLSISRLIVKTKRQYERAFLCSEMDEDDMTYFLKYKLKTMTLAYQELKRYIDRKANEKRALTRYFRHGINERQALILKWLDDDPDALFTVKEIETRFVVANQTARNDLRELTRRGFLRAVPVNQKKKMYGRSLHFERLLT
ncbi:MAG: Fic family protein [Catalinimonas sp.]